MKFSSLTASERRGIIILAIITLLITGAGILMSFQEKRNYPELPETNVLIDGDTIGEADKSKNKKEKTKRRVKTSSKKEKKTYRRRSPLDEPV